LHGDVDVVWQKDDVISHAHFLDVFEPLPGVTFVGAERGWDVEAWAPAPDAPATWRASYAELRPKLGPVLTRIQAFLEGMPRPFAACHVRRTDHVPNMATIGITPESVPQFLSWAASLGQAMPLYVATDNGETQRQFQHTRDLQGWRTYFGTYLDGAATQGITDHRRNGTLADAVVDLWVATHATHFKGTQGSSFTDAIETMRGLR
jgi:hypothetical protein